ESEELEFVSCSGPNFCLAFTKSGYTFSFDGAGWGNQQAYRTSFDIGIPDELDCFSPSSCIGYYTKVNVSRSITWDGTGWDHSTDQFINPDTPTITGMSCVNAQHCVAVDWSGKFRSFDGATWSDPVAFDVGGGEPTSVSCASTSWCVALDDHG